MTGDDKKLLSEYKEFSYIVAHDLKAPIRQLQSLTKLLLDSIDIELTPEQQKYREMINRVSEKSGEIVNALSRNAQLQTEEWPLTKTDLNTPLNNALSKLEAIMAGTNAVIKIDELPIVTGNPELLSELFYHLIDNGIKFQTKGNKPKIHIGLTQQDGKDIIYIKDNGIGIPPEKIETAFAMLRSIHKNDGLGVGLTFAKKIIEIHNGKIWIEPAPKAGTTISFKLE